MTAVSPTLFNRSLSRSRPWWLTLAVCGGLFVMPFAAAAVDGVLTELIRHPIMRPILLPSVIISYIILSAPLMSRGEADMMRHLRPIVLVDDAQFASIVTQASRINPVGEVTAAAFGAIIGFGYSLGWDFEETPWLSAYITLGLSAMFAVLAWTIYESLASTKLLAALHRQPMAIDLLDISPLEPIGRQSLLSTLVFLGGILLGMVFGLDMASFLMWRTWLAYGPLALFVVLLFFLSMRDTHRVLTTEKKRELEVVNQRLHEVTSHFRRAMAADKMDGEVSATLAGLLAYERRIRSAPTWPYNMTMIQTLLFSILLPLLVKALTWVMFER